jgi:hypothetical protein
MVDQWDFLPVISPNLRGHITVWWALVSLPDGKLSLPETLANLDAALTVLWARRQLVAAIDIAEGRPAPTPPPEFT